MKISLGTAIFDRIKKTEKANFVTKLSAIGGTMGLFTGFSLISGVEIFYFVIRSLFELVKQRKRNLNKTV